ncbi:MAG: MFS transporter [Anaerolineae bacterium]|nr:MFS transporter [Anaerolineae bacterium]
MIDPAIGARAVKQGLLVAKSYYFLYFAAIGCFAPFLNIYLKQKGLTGAQIGWLSSIAPLIALTTNPIWGSVADRWRIHRQVLALCSFVAGITALLFLPFEAFWLFMVLTSIIALFRSPITPIVDSAAIAMVKQTGDSYGRQRIWGTISFIVVSLGLGQILTGRAMTPIFWLYAGFLGIGCTALSFFLPVERVEKQVRLRSGISNLLGQRGYLSFLVATILLGMGTACYVGFLGLYIQSLGGTAQQVGLAWTANALLEIPIMFFGKQWFARYSPQRVILAAMCVYALVWLLIGLSQTPFVAIVCVLGMGVCFGTFWIGAVDYVSSVAPPGLGATAQTLFGAAISGLGWSLGSVAAGYLWDTVSPHAVFFFAAFAAMLAALVFGIGSRSHPN